MPGNFKKEDLRIRKTNEALVKSLYTLLSTQKFVKISVNELCEEALVSRTTFYSHFIDKYELLQYSLVRILQNDLSICNESNIITVVNDFIMMHERVIKNIVEEADEATLELLREFIEALINRTFGHSDAPANIMLTTFYTGGIASLIKWQVKNRFPANMQLMNADLCNLLKYIMELYLNQK